MTDAQDQYDERRLLDARRRIARRRPKFGTSARAHKITGKPCRVCGAGSVEYHHIVPRSHITSPDVAHHANAMPLCHACHQDHHTTPRRVPRRHLTPDELEFVLSRMGAGWLDRWYPCGDRTNAAPASAPSPEQEAPSP